MNVILIPFVAALSLLSGFAFGTQLTTHQEPLALGVALPSGTAVFETSLQDRISSTDTSLSIVSASIRGGGTLTGYQCFTIDEGRSDSEYVCGTLAGTTLSALERGLDPLTATTTNALLQFAHRKGANVKITDFPLIQRLRNQANGSETYPNALSYASGVACSNDDQLCDKGYVDALAFSGAGVINATTATKGVSELADQIEAASSTTNGSSGVLVLPASIATSSYNAATAALRVLVTGNTGKLDNNFINTSTLFATSSIATTPIGQVGKNVQVFTSTGTSTFSVPTGVTKISVEVQAAGGAGGGSQTGGAGGGGGGGGYATKVIDVTGTSTIQLFVGSGGTGVSNATGGSGTWSTFGTNGFYFSATAGTGGTTASGGAGGDGGVGVGGDINIKGGGGGPPESQDNPSSGMGGSSRLGGGAPGVLNSSAGATGGQAGGNYGGGGGGSSSDSGNVAGGIGAQGIVIVRW